MSDSPQSGTDKIVKKWNKKRGALIMALHEIQEVKGYVPWEDASEVAIGMNIPLARIYEVLTFYNYFKLVAPGRAVISVCTGTACFLKGNDKVDYCEDKYSALKGSDALILITEWKEFCSPDFELIKESEV